MKGSVKCWGYFAPTTALQRSWLDHVMWSYASIGPYGAEIISGIHVILEDSLVFIDADRLHANSLGAKKTMGMDNAHLCGYKEIDTTGRAPTLGLLCKAWRNLLTTFE